jgi:hypothetical protein
LVLSLRSGCFVGPSPKVADFSEDFHKICANTSTSQIQFRIQILHQEFKQGFITPRHAFPDKFQGSSKRTHTSVKFGEAEQKPRAQALGLDFFSACIGAHWLTIKRSTTSSTLFLHFRSTSTTTEPSRLLAP